VLQVQPQGSRLPSLRHHLGITARGLTGSKGQGSAIGGTEKLVFAPTTGVHTTIVLPQAWLLLAYDTRVVFAASRRPSRV
jgi:glucose-6-phosphate-specific signal transduction histidine kinase